MDEMKCKTRPVGSDFTISDCGDLIKHCYRVTAHLDKRTKACEKCAFRTVTMQECRQLCNEHAGECVSFRRTDGQRVYFRSIPEKIAVLK